MMDSEFVASLGLFVASSLFFSIGRRRCVKERLLLASNRSPRPENRVDYRAEGGPLLEYLWCDGLKGQSLYLGGEVGSDGKIYFIPGHGTCCCSVDCCSGTVEVEVAFEPSGIPSWFLHLGKFITGPTTYTYTTHTEWRLSVVGSLQST